MQQGLEKLKERVAYLEARMDKIPDPFVIYYREPGKEGYSKLNEALDNLHADLEKLKNQ